jgi:ketosteroid isomerase-like protein
MKTLLVAVALSVAGCACLDRSAPVEPVAPSLDINTEMAAINAVVDAWHAAAAGANEAVYFGHLTEDAIFLGTDATERWDKKAFQAYAHPHFAKGKAWSFKSARRNVVLSSNGTLAWFDEDLVTPNLGPSRGSGVLRKEGGGVWRIAHYNLTITVPNERFKEVKALLDQPQADQPQADQLKSGNSSN